MAKAGTHYKQMPIAKVKKVTAAAKAKSAPQAENCRIAPATRKSEPYSIPLDALDGSGPLSSRGR